MTQEEKELLLQDLCTRLPYKPRVKYYYSFMGVAAISGYSDEGYLSYQKLEDFSIYPKYGLEKTRVCNILPYLRPMSSMTEEEKKEVSILLNYEFYIDDDCALVAEDDRHRIRLDLMQVYIDWLNANHFDYRGLIEKGLALEAPEGMYNTKTE